MEFIILLFVLLGGLLLYMLYLGFGNNILRHQITASGIPEKKRIFFISDTHNRTISNKVIERIRGEVDWIIIGGDFADKRTSFHKLEENLKRLTSVAPTFFIWGNNDEEVGEQAIVELFKRYGVTIVANDSNLLTDESNVIRLCAVHFHESEKKIEKSLRHCQPNDAIIYVAHNPEVFPSVLRQIKPLLLLGGHLHGGQIRLGRFGMFSNGSFTKQDGVHTLISNGYGTTLVPLRLGAKAQTHIIEITFE